MTRPASTPRTAIGNIAEQIRRCTVQVSAPNEALAGSGVVLSPGVAVTNAHVVGGAAKAQVRLWDGEVVSAAVERRDTRRDLALLRIPDHDITYATLRDSRSVHAGELALAVGSPLGFIGAVSMGIVRTVGPVRALGRRSWIQADVRLAPGNSGGPLADAHGEVIGINTMIFNRVGLAVPADTVQQFLSARAPLRLGVTVRPLAVPAGARGLMVLELERGGVAERASLLPGDILVGLDEIALCSVDDLADALERAHRKVSIRFKRGGEERVRQTTGEAP